MCTLVEVVFMLSIYVWRGCVWVLWFAWILKNGVKM